MNSKTLTEDQVKKSVSHLSHSFKDACERYRSRTGDNKNVKGTFLYQQQVEFSHCINEMQRGPLFFAMQQIAVANEVIAEINAKTKN